MRIPATYRGNVDVFIAGKDKIEPKIKLFLRRLSLNRFSSFPALALTFLALAFLTAPAPAATIGIGARHGLGIRSDGTVVAWGYSYDGQCGIPEGLNLTVKFKVPQAPIAPVLFLLLGN
jgi:hypothetical protein